MHRLTPRVTNLLSLAIIALVAVTVWLESKRSRSAAPAVSRKILSPSRGSRRTEWEPAFSQDWHLATDLLAQSLASEDPVVAAGAANAVQLCLDQWRVLDQASSRVRVEALAGKLATQAKAGRQFPRVTRDIVFRMLRWPTEPSSRLGGHCDAILHALQPSLGAGTAAAF